MLVPHTYSMVDDPGALLRGFAAEIIPALGAPQQADRAGGPG
jgi:hypothetical protein